MAQPAQCFDDITPNNMYTSKICGVSGSLVIIGAWATVVWAFLRALHIHLQICWDLCLGRRFMIFAHVTGWLTPFIGATLALVFSGVSVRYSTVCSINPRNSQVDMWNPLIAFAGATIFNTLTTFGYCVKVYIRSNRYLATASLGDEGQTESGLKALRTGRHILQVLKLQWRGIVLVLFIVANVVLFSIVFIRLDNMIDSVAENPELAEKWIICLIGASGDKEKCFDEAQSLVVDEVTVSTSLLLLAVSLLLVRV